MSITVGYILCGVCFNLYCGVLYSFVMYGCVYVWVLYCVGVCVFCNSVGVCVCVDIVIV